MHPDSTAPRHRAPKRPNVECVCERCGKVFVLNASKALPGKHQGPRRFCSRACLNPRSADPIAAFWSRVDQSAGPDGCWPWTAGLFDSGYGQYWYEGRGQGTHRLAWIFTHGPIPEGMSACHSCDVRYPPGDISYRKCSNPAHLWLGTTPQNTRDAASKGRMASGERAFARLHPERMARGERHYAKVHPEKILRGERIGNSKLSPEAVLDIRARRANRSATIAALAREYRVAETTIKRIMNGRNWSHL